MIPICAVFLWGNLNIKLTIGIYAGIIAFGYFLTAIVALIIVFKKAKSKFLKLKWNFPFSLMIIRYSMPFAILSLLMAFTFRIDTVMLERMLPDGSAQSGIYASAYRLLDGVNMFAYLFAAMLLPIFARMLKHKEKIDDLIKLAYTLLMVPAFIVAVGSYFYNREIMLALYPLQSHETIAAFNDRINQSSFIFSILMICFVCIATQYVFSTLLTANKNLKQLNIIAGCGMILNIILNLILIPHFKSKGSACSSITTQLLITTAQLILVKYRFKFKINYKLIFSLILFVLGLFAINHISKNYIHVSWVVSFLIMVASSILWAFAIRIISIKNIYNILKYG